MQDADKDIFGGDESTPTPKKVESTSIMPQAKTPTGVFGTKPSKQKRVLMNYIENLKANKPEKYLQKKAFLDAELNKIN